MNAKQIKCKCRLIKPTICLIVIILNFPVYAQKKGEHSNSYLDFYYGPRSYNQNFYGQLNTTGVIKLNKPLQVAGISACNLFHVSRAPKRFYGNLLYTQVIPQTIYIDDTLKGKIIGFVAGFAAGARLVSKYADVACYLGFNTGRLRIYDNELIRQKNPFFSPKIGMQSRLKFGKFAISSTLEYECDVSKPTWRRTNVATTDKVNISNLNQTGLTLLVGIGFVI